MGKCYLRSVIDIGMLSSLPPTSSLTTTEKQKPDPLWSTMEICLYGLGFWRADTELLDYERRGLSFLPGPLWITVEPGSPLLTQNVWKLSQGFFFFFFAASRNGGLGTRKSKHIPSLSVTAKSVEVTSMYLWVHGIKKDPFEYQWKILILS